MDLHPSMYDDAARKRIEELQTRIRQLEEQLAAHIKLGQEILGDPAKYAKRYAEYHSHLISHPVPKPLTSTLARIVDVVPSMVRAPSVN